MRKKITAALLVVVLCLAGCGGQDDPYRVETVIRIPVSPTEATAAQTEEEATEEATEEVGEATDEPTEETVPPTEKPSSGDNKGSGNKGGSNKGSGKDSQKETQPKQSEPPATEPPVTEPPVTDPPSTEAPVTEPPETEPAAEPEETSPEAAATQPPQETESTLYDISGYSVGALEYAMGDEINGARTAEGLSEYWMDSRLCAIASCRAYEISQVWSHTRPDGRGYASVLSDYGYGAGTVTELLVYVTGDGNAADIVAKWMGSESHRESLLGGYSGMGIGIYRANGYTYVCCLLVG